MVLLPRGMLLTCGGIVKSALYMYLAEYDKNTVMQKSLGNPKTVELYF